MDITNKLNAISDIFVVMKEKENTVYLCSDYLGINIGDSIRDEDYFNDCPPPRKSTDKVNTCSEFWREQICEWSYKFVDHYDIKREVVAISISYLDRFIARHSIQNISKRTFQLVAITSLFIAIKLNEKRIVHLEQLAQLSRGMVNPNDILAMEVAILRTLSYHVHPPTSHYQANLMLRLLPDHHSLSPGITATIIELSQFLTELGVCDYFFVTRKFSSVALASLLNALERVNIPSRVIGEFSKNIRNIAGLDPQSEEVVLCRKQLHDMHIQSMALSSEDAELNEHSISPVCVSGIAQDTRATLNSQLQKPQVNRSPTPIQSSAFTFNEQNIVNEKSAFSSYRTHSNVSTEEFCDNHKAHETEIPCGTNVSAMGKNKRSLEDFQHC